MQRIKYVFLSLLEDKQQFKLGVVMTGHLTLLLACFSVGFVAKRRSIRMIAYDFGIFVMFSIFESVILVFLKNFNFRGFLK